MSALQALQGEFQDYVLGDGAVRPAMHAAVRDQFGLQAEARLAIYYRAYRSRLRQALCEAYDKTWSYIGDAMFAELADSYLTAHPSQYRNLRWFGDRFAAHAARELEDYPYIGELARFEWVLGLTFDAADAPALGADDLAHVAPAAWGDLTFALRPSVHLLALDWNTVALWQALDREQTPPDAEQSVVSACWLVWRMDQQAHFRSLDAVEAHALRGIGSGMSFGAVCAAAGEQAAPALAGHLHNWLAQGVLLAARAPG